MDYGWWSCVHTFRGIECWIEIELRDCAIRVLLSKALKLDRELLIVRNAQRFIDGRNACRMIVGRCRRGKAADGLQIRDGYGFEYLDQALHDAAYPIHELGDEFAHLQRLIRL